MDNQNYQGPQNNGGMEIITETVEMIRKDRRKDRALCFFWWQH